MIPAAAATGNGPGSVDEVEAGEAPADDDARRNRCDRHEPEQDRERRAVITASRRAGQQMREARGVR